MQYTHLAAWVRETGEIRSSLEACYIIEDRLILLLKGGQKLCFVLSSADSFAYLSNEHLALDAAKLMFQGIKNAQLAGLEINGSDRIIYLNLLFRDIYQQQTEYVIVAEMMPPQANVILCQKKGAKLNIIDAVRKYSYADNPQRQVLPGLEYTAPKTAFTPESMIEMPPVPQGFTDWNTYLRKHYEDDIRNRGIEQKRNSQKAQLKRELKKLEKKLKLQEQDLAEATKADLWRDYAEALKPNLKAIAKGQNIFVTINYFDTEMKEIQVPLLADKSPHENLQHYLKKYHKAKNGLGIISQNIAKTKEELERSQELLNRMEAGEEIDLNLKSGTSAEQIIQKANALDKLLSLQVGEEWQIVIGRKAKENDFVTTQLGRPHDWWFHSRIYHGAHVLLRCLKKKDPSPELIRHCCNLAAWYSQAKHSLNVPVDYTQIRFVRKPRKAAPGYVIYTNQHTVYATPMDIREVRALISDEKS